MLLKNCENKEEFNKKQYVRIAIRNMQDNDALIHALRQLIKD